PDTKSNGNKVDSRRKRSKRSRSSSSSSSSSSSGSDSDEDKRKKVRSNGKNKSMSKSPSKKVGNNESGTSSGKTYDYMTKLNYLFRDTRFFLIKSNNADNVEISKKDGVWATLPQNEANLNQAFRESRNVLLIFSVNESGKFAGFARMSAESNKSLEQPKWVLPPTISAKSLGGVITIDWICHKELPFINTQH
uniref:YTH domain-containing protein n=1 Tax=Megaselia scalaris TaxID=36166 RepID=T1GJ87_MEGSC